MNIFKHVSLRQKSTLLELTLAGEREDSLLLNADTPYEAMQWFAALSGLLPNDSTGGELELHLQPPVTKKSVGDALHKEKGSILRRNERCPAAVKIQCIDGDTLNLCVTKSETVNGLKIKMQRVKGYKPDFTYLCIQGQEQELKDDLSVATMLKMYANGGGSSGSSDGGTLQLLCTFEQEEYETALHDRYIATTQGRSKSDKSDSKSHNYCNTLNHGPAASASCEARKKDGSHSFHHWLCLKCGYEQYSVNCVNKCDWGEFGWTCINTSCKGAQYGCKKGNGYWKEHGADWRTNHIFMENRN